MKNKTITKRAMMQREVYRSIVPGCMIIDAPDGTLRMLIGNVVHAECRKSKYALRREGFYWTRIGVLSNLDRCGNRIDPRKSTKLIKDKVRRCSS